MTDWWSTIFTGGVIMSLITLIVRNQYNRLAAQDKKLEDKVDQKMCDVMHTELVKNIEKTEKKQDEILEMVKTSNEVLIRLDERMKTDGRV